MTTIKDVAKLADVSTATVSYVLSGKRYVSRDLIERVNQAILHLDYRSNSIAKSLKTKRTNTIGVIVSDIQNPYFAGVVTGIETYCFKKGYGIILGESYESPKREIYNINLLMEKRVDGFIIAPVGKTQKALDSLGNNIPFLLVNRTFHDYDNWSVTVNNEEGAYKATIHLLKLGHRSIGIILGLKEHSTSWDRFAGYRRALEEADIPIQQDLIRFSKLDTNSSCEKTLDLLREKKITAILATNNIITTGALLALKQKKIKVPQEISFVAFTFEESVLPFIVTPTLTYVSQPSHRVGLEAAKVLLSRLKNKVYQKKIIFETKFNIGDSTAPPSIKGDIGTRSP